MKILFVSAILPYPLYSGGQIRAYNLLKKLSVKHDIHLYTFIRSEEERQWVSRLSFCKEVVCVYRGQAWQPGYVARSVFGSYPFLFATYDNDRMRRILTGALADGAFDLVHIEPGYVWPSLPSTRAPVVVGEHNVEYDVYEQYVDTFPVAMLRPFLRLDTRKLRAWTRVVWQHAAAITVVSPEDKKKVAPQASGRTVSIIPNGVDVKEYAFAPKQARGDSRVFLFVGNFSWLQNRDAAAYLLKDIWPKLASVYPKAIIQIVGKNIPASIRSLGDGQRVRFLDDVPDIRKAYAGADIMLAPIRVGGGTKYKILEAMAVGLPVVTTPAGALGLSVVDGKDVCIAKTADGVVEAVRMLVADDARRLAMVAHARRLVEAEYAWDTIAKALDMAWRKAYETTKR